MVYERLGLLLSHQVPHARANVQVDLPRSWIVSLLRVGWCMKGPGHRKLRLWAYSACCADDEMMVVACSGKLFEVGPGIT